MRVLVIAHAWTPFHNGGAEVMGQTLARELVERGHQVDVALTQVDEDSPESAYDHDGVTVHPFGGPASLTGWFTDRPDVVVTHLDSTRMAAERARMFEVPLVVLCHNDMPHTLDSIARHSPELVVFNTEWMHARYRARFRHAGLTLPSSLTIHPPVRPEEYAAASTGDAVTLVNLCKAKGVDIFYALAERHPDVPFLGVRGGYGQQVVRSLPNVEVLPHVAAEEMRDEVYARTRIQLMPSSYESYGRVAAEAVCSGIPVIASPTDGLRECLGPAGTFCDRTDLEAWDTALTRLLDPQEWATASQASLDRAAEFDPETALARWTDAVEQLAS